jgi:hypothetical protein
MAMNPIPPQAYTKDSLLKAYAWLQNQDNSLKEMATTPDILVSLYLKATRDGDAALDRPSIQNFKYELKQLAGLMGEFEKEAPPEPKPKATESVAAPKKENAPKPLESLSLDIPALERKYNAQMQAASQQSGLDLDPSSLALIAEVKQKLNLTSNQEALKMLIQVGYNKVKKLL